LVRKDKFYIGVVSTLIVLPTVLALAAYFITKNPHFRPLGVTYDKLAEAGLIAESGEIVAVISIGAKSDNKISKSSLSDALELAFERYNSEVRIKFITLPATTDVTVTYYVGRSKIGPYPYKQAAKGIKASVSAERMVKAHDRALEKQKEDQQAQNNEQSWFRFFDN
jgi:hypothetical protein